eukprot:CAMPEP_0202979372 /NCGR_PEP_ID=MMETSP1396-20130829/85543_1 /ASSEMBLY_ACC=CAM_ASM_000872 /TAXON_ID= /ORGANISM="Pseudokeronopsis sp., Strain Brazil" /LENGTH=192 /DNA_ID=CAMNT_0049718773 /DNA_START=1790 /DNA_END=2368 /DNA_ORIENTATION=+
MADLDLSSDDGDSVASQYNSLESNSRRGQKTASQKLKSKFGQGLRATGVMQFSTHANYAVLEEKGRPFIQLTTSQQYLDVLCVNCYECVNIEKVDHHSLVCGKKGYHDIKYGLDVGRDLKRMVSSSKKPSLDLDDKDEDLNQKLFKLTKGIRNKLLEISKERENQELQKIIEFFSSFYSMSIKVFENNSDAN